MYEYHAKRYLPSHIQLPHNFLKTHIPRFRSQEQVEYQEQHPSHRKNSMTPLIGSVQVRIRYAYQVAPETPIPELLTPAYKDSDTHSLVSNSSQQDCSTVASSYSGRSKSSLYSVATLSSVNTHSTAVSAESHENDVESSDDNDDGEDEDNNSSFHEAVEPKLVYVDDLAEAPNTLSADSNRPVSCSQSVVDAMFMEQLENKIARRTESTRRLDPGSSSGNNFGFSRSDMENRRKTLQRKNSESSIRSHNFGDKNFARRWINESFEEVALAHPSMDRMIGFVVSPQTRILVRAVVKILTGFVRISSPFLVFISEI